MDRKEFVLNAAVSLASEAAKGDARNNKENNRRIAMTAISRAEAIYDAYEEIQEEKKSKTSSKERKASIEALKANLSDGALTASNRKKLMALATPEQVETINNGIYSDSELFDVIN